MAQDVQAPCYGAFPDVAGGGIGFPCPGVSVLRVPACLVSNSSARLLFSIFGSCLAWLECRASVLQPLCIESHL